MENHREKNNDKNDDKIEEKAAWITALIEMEHTFCKAAGEEGAIGWARFFSDSGVMLNKSGSPIKSPKTIENAIEPLFNLPGLKFVWEPTFADVSDDGTLGYTYGIYDRTYLGEDGEKIEEKGMYMSIWKKQIDGTWRIAADVGN